MRDDHAAICVKLGTLNIYAYAKRKVIAAHTSFLHSRTRHIAYDYLISLLILFRYFVATSFDGASSAPGF
jgi:hypothetical protein